MWNRSLDASFMVPMAVSLGFGVLFATLITLVLVPTAYMILDDVGRTMRRVFGGYRPAAGASTLGAGPQGGARLRCRPPCDL